MPLSMLDEWDGMRVGLRDYEIVHVKQLLQSVNWEVGMQGSVRPLDIAEVIGDRLSLRILGQELHSVKEEGQGARGRGRTPHQDIGSCEVVQEPGPLEI
mmetsp:Transcript_20604/g.32226  ORF Transcript_20604/g.32226 Transcript_20604/m.32226 type:complete len:99 (-) Transcript_20604:170-466(-)